MQRGSQPATKSRAVTVIEESDADDDDDDDDETATFDAAASQVAQFVAVATGGARVSTPVAVVLLTRERVDESRIAVTQLLVNICPCRE